MLFSVIVPVYKVEDYIAQCIESILNQSFKDFELILVVDGSPDRSLEICTHYRDKDSRVIVINKENGGATSSRKAAANIAKGEYIICVDGDDYVAVDLFGVISKAIMSYNYPDMIAFGHSLFYKKEVCSSVLQPTSEGYYIGKALEEVKKRYLFDASKKQNNSGSLNYALWSKVVKRGIYRQCQNQVPNHIKNGEDNLLIARMLMKVSSLAVLEYYGYFYRINQLSTTNVRVPYDLLNLSNVRQELLLLKYYHQENIERYYYTSLYILLKDMAIASPTYRRFKEIYIDAFNMPDGLKEYKFGKLDFKTAIKFNLIKYKRWKIFYYLSKKLSG